MAHIPHLQWSYFSPEAHLIMKIKKGPPRPPRCWKWIKEPVSYLKALEAKNLGCTAWFCYGKRPTRVFARYQ